VRQDLSEWQERHAVLVLMTVPVILGTLCAPFKSNNMRNQGCVRVLILGTWIISLR
jgi:hypothetical protein